MNELASAWLAKFNIALSDLKMQELQELFVDDCYWRDLVAFTWNIKTAEGRDAIMDMAAAVKAGEHGKKWALKGDAEDSGDGVVEAWFNFETDACNGVGHMRLRHDGRCWTLFTAAEALKGHPDPSGPYRDEGRPYGAVRGREAFGKKRAQEKASLGASDSHQPFAVIVGGGQCGLAIGARLKRMGVPAIIVDKYPRAGDCWRNRYDALHLHDPVFANHLPYIPLPADWPLWPHKDQMADFLEAYVKLLDLNYWASSTCLSAKWDDARKEWAVQVDKAGTQVQLKPKHLILATGLYGGPFVPELDGQEQFQGDVLHSCEYKNGLKYTGRHAIVVGSNTSAHDIAEDLWEAGAHVTMIQRSATMVTHIDTQLQTVFGGCNDEAQAKGISTDKSDLHLATIPFKIMTEQQKQRCKHIREKDAEYYRRLEAVGFHLDFGEDGSANIMQFLRRGNGYYFDTGASELIMNSEVMLAHGDVQGFTPNGVLLRDKSVIGADVVVLATGYRPFTDIAEKFIGKDMAAKLGKVWGLGSNTRGDPGPWEGELSNMWKPTAQEGLWVQGGNLSFSRNYSKYLALQLQARYLKIPTPVYGAPSQPEECENGKSSTAPCLGGC
jgi:putative flavoprotein involved in K+ transport